MSPDQMYLKRNSSAKPKVEVGSQKTYCVVNGFVNKTKDKMMVTAFRHVVTVTAMRAPNRFTNVKTMLTPRYPVMEKIVA